MNTLHLLGHCPNWNIDTYYSNSIGDGFIFCAYSFSPDFFSNSKINSHPKSEILKRSFLDLQYFGKKESGLIKKGKLSSYHFHPAANASPSSATNVYLIESIKDGVQFQINLGLKNIIIPNYYENDNIENLIGIIKTINIWLKKNKQNGLKYFMTIPITNHTIIDYEKIENLLCCLTELDIEFDGYYIICESKPESMTKISTDFKYLKNLSRVFEVLKSQKFITIYAYANWDAILFLATTDIDYITIGTFENLRNFNIKRFVNPEDGGPSKGWYFSEKLLNMVKEKFLELITINNGIPIISNERNIFSDTILNKNYIWNNQKPHIHKNYLLSIDRLLKEIASISNMEERKRYVLNKIQNAIVSYKNLEAKKIFLNDESRNYHLDVWEAYLRSK